MPHNKGSRTTADVVRELTIDERRTMVANLTRIGWTSRQIADELGVHRRTVGRDISALREQFYREAAENFERFIGVQIDRLNTLLNSHWQDAVSGNVPSTRVVLEIMDRMNTLYDIPNTYSIPAIEDRKRAEQDSSAADAVEEFLKRVEVRTMELTEVIYAFEGSPDDDEPRTIELKS